MKNKMVPLWWLGSPWCETTHVAQRRRAVDVDELLSSDQPGQWMAVDHFSLQ